MTICRTRLRKSAYSGRLMSISLMSACAATNDEWDFIWRECDYSTYKTLVKFDNYDISQAVPIAFLASGNATEGAQANDYWKKWIAINLPEAGR